MVLWQGPYRLADPGHSPPEDYLAQCRSDLVEYRLTSPGSKIRI
jgi:hypothetical protein